MTMTTFARGMSEGVQPLRYHAGGLTLAMGVLEFGFALVWVAAERGITQELCSLALHPYVRTTGVILYYLAYLFTTYALLGYFLYFRTFLFTTYVLLGYFCTF